jgi:PST family polysaccharide transporter
VTSPPRAASAAGAAHTYGQILKSSVLIGGSSALNLALGIIRVKAMALILGPSGIGLIGLYTAIMTLAQSIAGLGVNHSGVRQIAAAVGTGDTALIARTAAVIRRASIVLGLAGAVALLSLAGPVSRLTFGTDAHAREVALLSLAVLLLVVSGGQSALVQGLRRMGDLARIAVLGGLVGTIAGVWLVYAFRERGVVPSLIATAGATLAFSWWHSRKAAPAPPALSGREVRLEVASLLRLGVAFMASGMLIMGAAYVVRIFIVRQSGLAAAGLYQAAWAVGGLYVGLIIQSMAADFYPRLTAAITKPDEANRLVNEQAHVGLLLAGPGVIATLAFAPAVMTVLYSPAFRDAVDILRWLCLGTMLQVISFPLGFVIVAQSRQGIFFGAELAYTVAYLAMAWVLIGLMGAPGAGVAFFASYVFHALMVYAIVRRLTRFRWSRANRRTGALFLGLIAGVFAAFRVLPAGPATGLGVLALLGSGAYSLRALAALVAPEQVPAPVRRLLRWAGRHPA